MPRVPQEEQPVSDPEPQPVDEPFDEVEPLPDTADDDLDWKKKTFRVGA